MSAMNFGGLFKGWRRGDNEEPAAAKPQTVSAAPVPTPRAEPPRPVPVAEAGVVAPENGEAPELGADVELPLQQILVKLPQDLQAKMTMRIEDLGDATIAIPIEQIMPQLALGSVKITFGQLRGAAPELFRVAEEYDSLPVLLPLNVLLARLNPNLLPRNPGQRQIAVPDEIKGPFGPKADGVSFATSFMKAPPGPARIPAPAESQTRIQGRAVVSPPPAFARPAPAAPSAPIPMTPPSPPAAPAAPISPIAPSAPIPPKTSVPIAPVTPSAPPRPVAPPVARPPVAPPAPPIPMMPVAAPPAPSVPAAPAAPLPVVAPVSSTPIEVAPAAAAPAHGSNFISVPLSELSEKWPEPLKAEVQQMPDAQVALPLALLETPLRRGRVKFSWHNIRSWMTPKPAGTSPNEGAELELPLKVIVPLFFQASPPTRPPLRVAVDRAIPNLFFGFPTAEMEAPVAAPVGTASPAAPKPQPIAPPAPPAAPVAPAAPLKTSPAAIPSAPIKPIAPLPTQPLRTVLPAAQPPKPAAPAPPVPVAPVAPVAPAPAPVAAKPVVPMQASEAADTNFFMPVEPAKAPAMAGGVMSDTEMKRRMSTPKEIIERAMTIPGVMGAVIALPDGLKVAGQVPADLSADMVAAFLPQIFDRVGQSTRELRMGGLNNLKFTVGNVPWKIFRVNAVYFAAFGKPGERLPTAELAVLAAELDRKTK